MSWSRLLLAAFAGGVITSMTDWFFMGADGLYKKFDHHPEIWRRWERGEMRAVMWASVFPFLTCGAFAWLCAWLHLQSIGATTLLALAIWVIAAMPTLVVNGLFVKISPVVTAAYGAGWLVKLLVAAVAVALIAAY